MLGCVDANPRDIVYDLECYPNIFTACFIHPCSRVESFFEISTRTNQSRELYEYLTYLKNGGFRLVGFNNLGYDYPMLHHFLLYAQRGVDHNHMYTKNKQIIDTPWHRRFGNVIWDNDRFIEQVDLYKIHHYDNQAKSTSLKMLEFVMRSDSIEELPFEAGTVLQHFQMDILGAYNRHDVKETIKAYIETLPQIEFREKLTQRYGRNFINDNDTKIGKEFFIMQLEKSLPGSCYFQTSEGRKPRQTNRDFINLKDVIFDYIEFEQPEFQRIKSYLESTTIRETKGVFTDLSAYIGGFNYDFGTGGIHGSVEASAVSTTNDATVYDWDVASYYPNLAIANSLYPEHLSDKFCEIYKDIYDQRRTYDKGTPENKMLKLALNGVYGDSNNKYSPFYDPKYTMSITINGQLLLCMLAEQLIKIEGLQMVQINTDGLTVKCPNRSIEQMHLISEQWENLTGLTLESAVYKRMFIRDVNNYIAEHKNGHIKRKGAYEHVLENHKNHSELVVPMAASACLLYGVKIEDFIKSHPDIMDFMLRTKVGRGDKLLYAGTEQQKITRYLVTNKGNKLTKISPPAKGNILGQYKRANSLTDSFYNNVINEISQPDGSIPWDERVHTKNKSVYEERKTGISSGYNITVWNNIKDLNVNNADINYEYYIAQADKLVSCFQNAP